jgi:hypothetical protein
MWFYIPAIILVVIFALWFRRTPMYRLHRRRSGVVGGQISAWSGWQWYGGNPVPQRPELRRDEEPAPTRRRWSGRRK